MLTKNCCFAVAVVFAIASSTLAGTIVEEDWFFPLRFESVQALDAAQYHFRRDEEKAAANEVDKAISWLKYAESHALPITKEKLTNAVNELTKLAKDLRDGNTISAAEMDLSLSRASHALAEWHYYKAKEQYGRDEAHYAAKHLEAAVSHLQHAATSAHIEYGPDTVTLIDDVYKDGKQISSDVKVDHNRLGMHLDAVEKVVKKMDDALSK